MITNANKGTYLVKNGQKHDNVIYERPLMKVLIMQKKPFNCAICENKKLS